MPAVAQQQTLTSPVVGLRQSDPSPILLVGGTVVTDPKSEPAKLDVLIRGNTIVRVADKITAEPGTMQIDMSGKYLYAGLIDAMRETAVPETDAGGPQHWNKNITPAIQASSVAHQEDSKLEKLRSQGITVQLLAPNGGIIKGTSCAVLLVDPKHPQRLLKENVFQHATITVPRGSRRDRYPNSPMGATALVRQVLYDAIWYREANRARELRPTLPRPEPNAALDLIANQIQSGTFVFDAANERMAQRAANIADEFSLSMVLRGSGREYRELEQIAEAGLPILLPVNFPDAPDTGAIESIRSTPLVDWMHWHLAPQNPAKLETAKVTFCLTTNGLDDVGAFLKQVRVAIDRGLDTNAALAAMTTTPASVLGVDGSVGRVDAGMLANLLIADGKLFDKKTKVIETWVAGERFVIEPEHQKPDDCLVGRWELQLPTSEKNQGDGLKTVTMTIETMGKSLTGKITLGKKEEDDKPQANDATVDKTEDETEDDVADDQTKSKKDSSTPLKELIRQRERMTASLRLADLDESFSPGLSQLSILTLTSAADQDDGEPSLFGTFRSPDGSTSAVAIRRLDDAPDKNEDEAEKENDTDKQSSDQEDRSEATRESQADGIAMVHPLGAFGLEQPPAQPPAVLFRHATVWTSGPDGTIEQCDVLVERGKISAVGKDLPVDGDCEVIDCKGKHLSPGLIDCHSHAATDGGINESGQVVTAEVRIGDFIDNTDISIYRQLAGGVTTIHVLHGSANPIGGQSQTLKLRWGASMDDMKLEDAPGGIKFALGENVKRNQARYPNTRMGVEQVLRDQFLATRQYQSEHKAWNSGQRDGLPPRRDLQLDALAEVQNGQRWIHCHSYRQDEIVATLDVLEEFNIQIGTLQHILEGYKVADRMARHGAMASSFADWWAYKYEVFDAIPYNGVLMHDAGVIVSYNSDDPELARHLNTEAAKAVKYGGVPEQEALKFVTLNPAKQLRIDDRIGSIEVGKDADLVVWSGRPLSTTSRCEQTWLDGRRYFSIESDQRLRARDQAWKASLIQLAVEKTKKDGPPNKSKADKSKADQSKAESESEKEPELPEDQRWLRYDEFCNSGGTRQEAQ